MLIMRSTWALGPSRTCRWRMQPVTSSEVAGVEVLDHEPATDHLAAKHHLKIVRTGLAGVSESSLPDHACRVVDNGAPVVGEAAKQRKRDSLWRSLINDELRSKRLLMECRGRNQLSTFYPTSDLSVRSAMR